MTPEEIGKRYAKAAEKLRNANLFAPRNEKGLKFYGHNFDTSRRHLHQDSEFFASQIETVVAQVCGGVDHEAFESDFVVNLEAFSTLHVSGDVIEGRKRLAYAYIPIRLVTFLRYTSRGRRRDYYRHDIEYDLEGAVQFFGLGVGFEPRKVSGDKGKAVRPTLNLGLAKTGLALNRKTSDRPRSPPMQQTLAGLRIHRPAGWLTSSFVLFISSIPVITYLSLRIQKADVEEIIQTALAIAAATLLVVAAPLHRIIFNNWPISEALSARMTLDEDTVSNISGRKDCREVGIGLIARGDMELLSSDASYAVPFSPRGLNPGPMMLSILTMHHTHKLVVDQNGALVLMYGDENAVQLLVVGRRGNEAPLQARRYGLAKSWYVLSVLGAEEFLVS